MILTVCPVEPFRVFQQPLGEGGRQHRIHLIVVVYCRILRNLCKQPKGFAWFVVLG